MAFTTSHPPPYCILYVTLIKIPKNWEIQLDVHCGVGSLKASNGYRYIANCKQTALSFFEILHFE